MKSQLTSVCFAAILSTSGICAAQTIAVDVLNSHQPFSRAVFGQNLAVSPYYSEGYGAAYDKNLTLLNDTSMRGPAGGMRADSYNWKTREDASGPLVLPGGGTARGESTLDYLRNARDHNSMPVFTINQRGLGYVDGSGNVVYTDTSTTTLKNMAKDWVRYTNRIVQLYRQGDTITNSEDLRVLNSLSWAGPDYTSDLLLAPGEAPVPKVNYWEIGNEVNFYGSASSYKSRYKSITSAMRSQDSSIKVGPNITGGYQSGSSAADSFLTTLLGGSFWNQARVDFISYHPYGYQILGVPDTDHAGISQQLGNIRTNQLLERDWVKARVQSTRGTAAANAMPLLATEWNPSTYNYSYSLRQWNALGIVETAMSYADMGMTSANFWLWPAYIFNGAEIPQYKAMEALNQFGGDTIVSYYQSPAGNSNARLYITRDSTTGALTVWGMNFLFGDPGDQAISLHLSLNNLGIDPGQITLMRLANLNGPTTLIDQVNPNDPNNLSIGWINTDLTGMGLQSFDFTINPAELQVLVIQPAEGSQLMQGMVPTLDIQSVPEPGTIGLVLGGMVLMTLKRRRGR
ncbi:MAG: PEP-CTERM sorting domain-containing protein [Phycisphaerales bacterium]|jgi:hypothetical protein|nr:PEP-CTERM sorting domain-containing protein [Phycisphaerales bacterium]